MGLVVSLRVLFGLMQPWLITQQGKPLLLIGEIIVAIIVIVIATFSTFTTFPRAAYRLCLAGILVRANRLMFGLLFGIGGAVIGYHMGSIITKRAEAT